MESLILPGALDTRACLHLKQNKNIKNVPNVNTFNTDIQK